jgi:hypothetical protein
MKSKMPPGSFACEGVDGRRATKIGDTLTLTQGNRRVVVPLVDGGIRTLVGPDKLPEGWHWTKIAAKFTNGQIEMPFVEETVL